MGGIGRAGLVGAAHPAVVGGGFLGDHGLGLGRVVVGGSGLVGAVNPALVGGALVGGRRLVGGLGAGHIGGLGLGRVAVGGIGGNGFVGGVHPADET